MSKTLSQAIAILDQALQSRCGIKVTIANPKQRQLFRQRLYQAKKTDSRFTGLSVQYPDADSGTVWITHNDISIEDDTE